jgi:hypothetical protein
MYTGIGRSLGIDYFRIADQLTGEELSYLRRTRDFVDNDVLPVINGYWERAEFPWPLIGQPGKLGAFALTEPMLAEVCSMQLYCLRLGRLIEEGKLTDTIAAIAKMNNTRKARQTIQTLIVGRDITGASAFA